MTNQKCLRMITLAINNLVLRFPKLPPEDNPLENHRWGRDGKLLVASGDFYLSGVVPINSEDFVVESIGLTGNSGSEESFLDLCAVLRPVSGEFDFLTIWDDGKIVRVKTGKYPTPDRWTLSLPDLVSISDSYYFRETPSGVVTIRGNNLSEVEYERIAREWRETYGDNRQTVTIKGDDDD